MTRQCVFCGRHRTTREHVLPRWLVPFLPPQDPWRAQERNLTYLSGHLNESDLALPKRTSAEPLTNMTVRVVCQTCNSGWMSQLEDSVREALSTLVRGRPIDITPESARLISLWATKTALVAHFTNSVADWRTARLCSTLYQQKTPPPCTSIWMARNNWKDWGLRYEQVGIGMAKTSAELADAPYSISGRRSSLGVCFSTLTFATT